MHKQWPDEKNKVPQVLTLFLIIDVFEDAALN
jgi:hypothetical protein